LSTAEFEQLEKNILLEGVRDSLITWNGILIDGHNRYEIAQKHNLPFNTIEKHFENRENVICWIIDNQLGRRNLADYVRYELLNHKEELLKVKGKEKMAELSNIWRNSGLSLSDKPVEQHNTRNELSKELGWSTGKKAQADIIRKKAPEEIKERLRNNDISIKQAYEVTKQIEKM
jgi:ParB-like chromosome segregation protein Spo0J